MHTMNDHSGAPIKDLDLEKENSGTDTEEYVEDSSMSHSDNEEDINDETAEITEGPASPDKDGDGNEEEEEDSVITAIVRAREKPSEKPPEIESEDYLVDISFHPSADIIAGGTIFGDAQVYKYSVDKTELLATYEVHTKGCRAIEYSQDGYMLFTVSSDRSIMIIDSATGKIRQFYDDAHEDPLYTMSVINTNLFATGDEDGVVRLWDLRQPKHIFSSKKMNDYVSKILTNEDAKYMVCTSGEGSVTSFDIAGKCLHIQSEFYEAEYTCAGLFRKETKLVVGSARGSLVFYKWGEFGAHTDDFPWKTNKKAINCMVPISENIALTGWEDGCIRATYLFPHKHLGVVGHHSMSVEALDISHDGEYVASSSVDNKLRFWPISYFEDPALLAVDNKSKQRNLPSSNVIDRSEFFSDLAQ